jgi:MFS family permease
MEKNSYIAVIKNHHFRNLWLAQIISQIAFNMLCFILVIRVYQETHSNFAVSMLLLSFAIPAVIFGVVAGGLVDHFDRRDVLVACNLLRVFAFMAFFIFSSNLMLLYLFAVIISFITQAFIPAEAPSIADLVPPENLLPANSLFTISYYLSMVVGFVSAGPALRLFGSPYIYLIMSFFMLVATAFVYFLPSLRIKKKKVPLTFTVVGKTISEGLKFIEKNVRVKQALILLTFAQVLIMTLSVLAPGFADRVLEIDLTDSSLLIMGPAVVGLVAGAFLVGILGKRFHKGFLILCGILATGFVLIALSILSGWRIWHLPKFANLVLTLSCLFSLGLFNSFITVPSSTILQEDTGGQMRGRIYGVMTSATGGVSILPVVFSGIMADTMGMGITLFAIGFVILAIGSYKFSETRKIQA